MIPKAILLLSCLASLLLGQMVVAQTVSCADISIIPESDCKVLTDVYEIGGGATEFSSWFESNNPCLWFNLQCKNGRITTLDIDFNERITTLPDSISQLDALEILYMQHNPALTHLPAEIGKLASIKRIDLEDNQALTALPPEIGNLGTLEMLFIWDNDALTALPAEIGKLSNLFLIDITGNDGLTDIPLTLAKENFPKIGGYDVQDAVPTAVQLTQAGTKMVVTPVWLWIIVPISLLTIQYISNRKEAVQL